MAMLEGEIIDRIRVLIDSLRALSGTLALALASTPRAELSASQIDALVTKVVAPENLCFGVQ